MTTNLTPAEFIATQAKIAKINERATKRGFTGRFEVVGKRVEKTSHNILGFAITEVLFETSITGETPRYNGWTFLARVDTVGDTFTLATAPGVEQVDRSLVRPGHCDHCEHNRYRRNTFLVQGEDGEIKNVGSTCIKDFLGWEGNFAFISGDDVERDVFGSSSQGERTFSIETVLAVAYASIKVWGWKPASQAGFHVPTRERVATILSGRLPKDRYGRVDSEYLKAQEFVQEAAERATVIRNFLVSDEFSGNSTYVDNLKAIAIDGSASWAHLGLLASAPNAYTRHLETAADRAAKQAQWAAEKAAKATSEFFGQKGDKVEVKVTVTSIRWIDNGYGTTTLYTMRTEDGNIVKWFASRDALGEQEGVEVTLKGTIKDHDEWNGQKSTVLTRCKAL
jgi:hypothetical protein